MPVTKIEDAPANIRALEHWLRGLYLRLAAEHGLPLLHAPTAGAVGEGSRNARAAADRVAHERAFPRYLKMHRKRQRSPPRT